MVASARLPSPDLAKATARGIAASGSQRLKEIEPRTAVYRLVQPRYP